MLHMLQSKIWLNTLLLCHSNAVFKALKYFGENVTLQNLLDTQMDNKVYYAAEVVDNFLFHLTQALQDSMGTPQRKENSK